MCLFEIFHWNFWIMIYHLCYCAKQIIIPKKDLKLQSWSSWRLYTSYAHKSLWKYKDKYGWSWLLSKYNEFELAFGVKEGTHQFIMQRVLLMPPSDHIPLEQNSIVSGNWFQVFDPEEKDFNLSKIYTINHMQIFIHFWLNTNSWCLYQVTGNR